MRTTVRLDPALMRAAKKHASSQDMTLTALIEHALRKTLAERRAPSPRFELKLALRPLKARAGVNFADRRSLYDVMDEGP